MHRVVLPILLAFAVAAPVFLPVEGGDRMPPAPEEAGRSSLPCRPAAESVMERPPEESAAEPPPPPHGLPPGFPLRLPKEFGPGPRIRGRVVSEAGVPLTNLSVRTTTWRPTGRGCFKPTCYLGWTDLHPDGSFVFHVDARMLRDLPERKGRTPFSIEAEGHLDPKVELSPEQWESLLAGRDLVGLELRLRRAASLEVRVLHEDGRPCNRAGLFHSNVPQGGYWDYRGHTEDGVWRTSKLDPAYAGYLTAKWKGFLSNRAPLAGRLTAGETTRIDLRLAHRHSATVTVVIHGYRAGLVLEMGMYKFPLEGPVTTLSTLTGPHHLSISGRDPWTWEAVPFEIPRDVRNHTVEVDLPR